MATTARLDLSVWRNDETYEFKLLVRGLDLTNAALRAQVRLAPDTPGAALIDLFQVQDGDAEGVRFAGVSDDGGIPVSDVRIRINKSTRAGLPYAGELGDSARLAWVFTIDGVTRLVGDFVVLAHTLASDSAPTDRPLGYSASAGTFPNASATLTITEDQGAVVKIDGIEEILPILADAREAVEQAAAQSLNPRSDSSADAGRNRVLIANGGYFRGGASDTTGAFQASLPAGVNDARFTVIEAVVMDTNVRYVITISGSNGGGGWDYPIVTVSGSGLLPPPKVRFGRDAALRYCFWVGEADSTWSYPQFWITRVLFGGNVIPEAWAGAWQVSLVQAFANVQTGPITPIGSMRDVNPTFSGTMNGMQLRAPTLHGGTYVGFEAGINVSANSTYNHLYGYQAGKALTTGFNNAFFGLQVGSEATTAEANSGFGAQALQHVVDGRHHCAFGIHALLSQKGGIGMVAIGAGAMEYSVNASESTAIGEYAGRDNQFSRCVFLGQRAGLFGAGADDELWIGSIADAQGRADRDALIRGNMADKTVRINGRFACNGATPVAPTALPAALPTNGSASNAAMATMLNAIRASLVATGINTSA